MRNGPALTIDGDEVPLLFDVGEELSPNPTVDGMIFRLSFRAGLRVDEIAHLTNDAFLDPRGRLTGQIRISVTKGNRPRSIVAHPEILEFYERFAWENPDLHWFAASPRDRRQMRPSALCMHMKRRFEGFGFAGCTSHTGRATFITELARRHNEFGCSLWDVMEIAGHKHLSSTAKYLRTSENSSDLVLGLGSRAHRHHSTIRGRETNDFTKRNNRYASPADILRHRQHEAWVAEQFLRSRVQPQWRAERGVGARRRD